MRGTPSGPPALGGIIVGQRGRSGMLAEGSLCEAVGGHRASWLAQQEYPHTLGQESNISDTYTYTLVFIATSALIATYRDIHTQACVCMHTCT